MAPSDRTRTGFLLGLIVLFGVLSYMLVAPFLYYLIGAVVLVYIAYPLYTRIAAQVGNESVAAVLALTVLLLVAVVPSIVLTERVITQGQEALVAVGTSSTEYIDTAALEATILEFTGEEVDIEQGIRDAFLEGGRLISGELPGIISTVLEAFIGVFIMAVTMFYLFKRGDVAVQRVRDLVPLPEEQEDTLITELDTMSEAILIGHLLTALLQGILVGAGLWLVGIPDVFFWTFVMVLLGIIPLVGNFLVWAPAGLYLILLQDQVLVGAALLVYGGLVATVGDNLIRARVVGSRGRIHPLVVMVGVIGGLSMFGVLGVVLGPLVLGFFLALLRVYRDDFLG
ncbi:MAG: AI-2E family transporter, partial [Candidatus Nanohaloarchaea archaeon]|nr:AI-2E family transporter [Candidatus Nanohaloarchaea archaeon]